MQTRGPAEADGLLDAIRERPALNEISVALALYGFVLMVPATLGAAHLLRRRAVVLGHIAGTLLIEGWVSFAFVAGTESILFIAGADTSLDEASVVAVNDRLDVSVVFNPHQPQ